MRCYIVNKGVPVMIRKLNNYFEPCTLINDSPKLFYENSVFVNPDSTDELSGESIASVFKSDGYFVFTIGNSKGKLPLEGTIMVVHRDFVTEHSY